MNLGQKIMLYGVFALCFGALAFVGIYFFGGVIIGEGVYP